MQYYSLEQSSLADTITTNILFAGNVAEKGQTLFGGLLDRCIPSLFSENSQKTVHGRSYITHISNISIETNQIASEPLAVHFCNGDEIKQQHSDLVYAKREQSFNVTLIAYDQNFNSLPAVIYSSLESGKGKTQAIQSIEDACTTVSFKISSPYPMDNLTIYPEGPCRGGGISEKSIVVAFLPCPIGFQLSRTNVSCECHSKLQELEDEGVVTCDIEMERIQRRGEFWVSFSNTTNESGIVVHPHCPYNYCHPPTPPVQVDLESAEGADAQCAFHRTGTLCGACKEGYSLVLGSSRCKQCSNRSLALIIPLALAGVVLIALILLLNLTVDVGSINGLILYANIVAINRSILFPIQKATSYSFTVLGWINLDLGIETCFYDGMDKYSKTWLEVALIIYLYLLAGLLLAAKVKAKSYILSKLFLSTNPAGVFATVLLITYTKILRVIATIFSHTAVAFPNHTEYVWLADANVPYIRGKHIGLFILALVLSTYILMFTILNICSHHVLAAQRKTIFSRMNLKPLLLAYHSPYMKGHQYWTGTLLIFRIVAVILESITTPTQSQDFNLMLLTILIYVLITLKDMTSGMYKSWRQEILETSQLLNLCLLTTVSLFVSNDNTQVLVSATSAHIATLTLVGVVAHSTYVATKLSTAIRRITSYLQGKFTLQEQGSQECNLQTISPSTANNDITNTTTTSTTIEI